MTSRIDSPLNPLGDSSIGDLGPKFLRVAVLSDALVDSNTVVPSVCEGHFSDTGLTGCINLVPGIRSSFQGIRRMLLYRGEFTKLHPGGAERSFRQIVQSTLHCWLSHAAAVIGVDGLAGGAHDRSRASRLCDGQGDIESCARGYSISRVGKAEGLCAEELVVFCDEVILLVTHIEVT